MSRFVVLALIVAFSNVALADEPPEGGEVMTGKIVVKMSSDYAKPYINGDEFEGYEFEDDGKTLLIVGQRRDATFTVKLVPMYPDLAPVEFDVKPTDWKLETVGKNVKEWQLKKTVKFDKAKLDEPPKETAPELAPLPPPPPPVDDSKAGEDFLKGTPPPKAPSK
jgi:hypothetical protein